MPVTERQARARASPLPDDLRREVHLWIVHLDAPPPNDDAMEVLSSEERARSQRIRDQRRRQRFVERRAALRLVLGTTLDLPARRVPLTCTEQGQPVLVGTHPLHFSISGCGEIALIALTAAGPIGVDVQSPRPAHRAARLARRYFTAPEADTIASLAPARARAAFLRCWTSKEAVLKALGTGLSDQLAGVAVEADPRRPLVLRATPDGSRPDQWSLLELCLCGWPTLAVALAIRAPYAAVTRVHQLAAPAGLRASEEHVTSPTRSARTVGMKARRDCPH